MNFRLPTIAILMVLLSYCTTLGQESKAPNALVKIDLAGLDQDELDEVELKLKTKISDLEDVRRTSLYQMLNCQTKLNELIVLQLSPKEIKTRIKERREDAIETAKEFADFMTKFGKYLKTVSESDELTIYAGLPRGDKEQLQKIKDDYKTIKIFDFDFYANPVEAKPASIEDLRSDLVDYQLFQPYGGPKFCGGFHPDFCIQWTADGKTYNMQICFTCHEAAFITPDERLPFDLTDAGWKKFANFALATLTRHTGIIKKLDEMYSSP